MQGENQQRSLANALGRATELHRAGRLRDGETLYRQVLKDNAQHFDALYNSNMCL